MEFIHEYSEISKQRQHHHNNPQTDNMQREYSKILGSL